MTTAEAASAELAGIEQGGEVARLSGWTSGCAVEIDDRGCLPVAGD